MLPNQRSGLQVPRGVLELTSTIHPDQDYLLYVPPPRDGRAAGRILVIVHGYSRRAMAYVEQFTEFAARNQYILLAPIFPASMRYQLLGIGSRERSDLRLLDLVDEIGVAHNVATEQFDLFGYSGGGQFAHRFLYVHPERLRAVAVGAPGTITIPSKEAPWPAGLSKLPGRSGIRFKLEAVRRPRVLLVIGQEDVRLEDLNQAEWAMRFGATRLGRARALHAAWLVAGIEHEYVEVPAAGHGLGESILEPIFRFFAGH